MACNSVRNFERYTLAFIDYQLASVNFNEAIFNVAKNGTSAQEIVDELAHILTIKHAYFLECAQRVLGARDFRLAPPTSATCP